MAARTSASATKSTGLGGGAGCDGASGTGAGNPTGQDATAPEPVSQPNSLLEPEAPRRARKRSTTWAVTFGTTEDETTGGAATGTRREARYRSTIFETTEDTGWGAGAAGCPLGPIPRDARYRSTAAATALRSIGPGTEAGEPAVAPGAAL